jgi:hypothetical protein
MAERACAGRIAQAALAEIPGDFVVCGGSTAGILEVGPVRSDNCITLTIFQPSTPCRIQIADKERRPSSTFDDGVSVQASESMWTRNRLFFRPQVLRKRCNSPGSGAIQRNCTDAEDPAEGVTMEEIVCFTYFGTF